MVEERRSADAGRCAEVRGNLEPTSPLYHACTAALKGVWHLCNQGRRTPMHNRATGVQTWARRGWMERPQEYRKGASMNCSQCGKRIFNGTSDGADGFLCYACSDPSFAALHEWGSAQEPASRQQPTCSQELRDTILEHYGYRCYVCGTLHRRRAPLDMHRIVPGARGGAYTFANVVPVCRRCHQAVEGLDRQAIDQRRGAR